MPLDCFVPSWCGTYAPHAQAFLFVGGNEHLHLLVAAHLPKVPSMEIIAADGSLAHHFDTPAFGPGHRDQRGPPFSAAEFTREAAANVLTNRYSPLLKCLSSILADNGFQFCSKLSHVVYKLADARKMATSSYQPEAAAWSVPITPRRKCWLWPSLSVNMAGICNFTTRNFPVSIRAAPPLG